MAARRHRHHREGIDRWRLQRSPDVNRHKGHVEFINPYPWMSAIEAMVHLDLEERRVPFSWRYFDGDSVTLTTLVPGFAPEYTLREYRVVILIAGNYWGTLPGVLDTNALAAAILASEGWTIVTLFENDIRHDVHSLIDKMLPMLVNPTIVGRPRPNPYGNVDLMSRRREHLRGQALARTHFKTKGAPSARKRRHLNPGVGDLGRHRKPRTQ